MCALNYGGAFHFGCSGWLRHAEYALANDETLYLLRHVNALEQHAAEKWPSQWEANLLAEFAALNPDLFHLVLTYLLCLNSYEQAPMAHLTI